MTKNIDVVIIGGGPAGISAAIWCKRLGMKQLLIESRSKLGGQLHEIQNEIIDYPGILTKNGLELKQFFNQHIAKLRCNVSLNTSVLSVDLPNRTLIIQQNNGHSQMISYRYIILATGSSPRKLNVPGEAEMIRRGEVYSASEHRSQFKDKKVAVIGGGDRAFEGALLLAESGAQVVLIHRSNSFRARKEYVDPVIRHPNIEILPNSVVEYIDGDQRVEGIGIISERQQKKYIAVEGVFIRIGVQPNSDLLRGAVDTDEDQYIIVSPMYRTSQPDIYAIGDVSTQPLYSSIASAVGQGMVAAKSISIQLEQENT